MAFKTIELEVDDGVARLTLSRSDRLNSFAIEMHGEVAATLTHVEESDEIRTLVVTGAGRAFCATTRPWPMRSTRSRAVYRKGRRGVLQGPSR